MVKIAIVYYSTWGHVKTIADAEKRGIEKAGGTVDVFQIPETLSEDVLTKMYAPPKPTDIPVLDDPSKLEEYDAFLLGIPTRYGNFPAQWKTFWDKTGKQWSSGGFWGKLGGLFISTGTLGGGQESTAIAAMSTFAHHGIIYVPFGYAKAFAQMSDLSEVHGGSPWGAGTFSAGDGSRQPSAKEIEIAEIQGAEFYKTALKHFGCLDGPQNGEKTGPTEGNGAAKDKPVESNGTAPATGTAPAKGHSPRERRPEDGDDKEGGPCGLPTKCVVS